MKFQTSHTFSVSPREYMDIYFLPEFEQYIVEHSSLKERTIVSQTRDGDIITRKMKICSGVELPSMLRNAVGMRDLCYFEDAVIDLAAYETRWRINPEHFQNKIRASGTTIVYDRGAAGCERTINGEISVSIPFVGGLAESFIIESIKKTYSETARLFEKFYQQRIS